MVYKWNDLQTQVGNSIETYVNYFAKHYNLNVIDDAKDQYFRNHYFSKFTAINPHFIGDYENATQCFTCISALVGNKLMQYLPKLKLINEQYLLDVPDKTLTTTLVGTMNEMSPLTTSPDDFTISSPSSKGKTKSTFEVDSVNQQIDKVRFQLRSEVTRILDRCIYPILDEYTRMY